MRRKKKNKGSIGVTFCALGVGVIMVCLFPSKWMVIIMALALVMAGAMLMKHC